MNFGIMDPPSGDQRCSARVTGNLSNSWSDLLPIDPSPLHIVTETTVLKVLLHCDGCVSKVKRHIRRLEGVESFHVDQKNSKVTVYSTVKPQVVLDKVLRAGKTAEFWPQSVEELAKVEVPDTPIEATAQVAAQEVGKKKKASENAGDKATKKLKNGKKVEHEEGIELEDVGDGEIVDLPVLEGDDKSDERVLIKKKNPRKKGIFTRG